ncbi:hypothetical protein D3C72_1252920 [compost metagenome]
MLNRVALAHRGGQLQAAAGRQREQLVGDLAAGLHQELEVVAGAGARGDREEPHQPARQPQLDVLTGVLEARGETGAFQVHMDAEQLLGLVPAPGERHGVK